MADRYWWLAGVQDGLLEIERACVMQGELVRALSYVWELVQVACLAVSFDLIDLNDLSILDKLDKLDNWTGWIPGRDWRCM